MFNFYKFSDYPIFGQSCEPLQLPTGQQTAPCSDCAHTSLQCSCPPFYSPWQVGHVHMQDQPELWLQNCLALCSAHGIARAPASVIKKLVWKNWQGLVLPVWFPTVSLGLEWGIRFRVVSRNPRVLLVWNLLTGTKEPVEMR